MDEGFLGIDEAARLCRLSVATVRRWVESGELPSSRGPQGEELIDPARLDAFLRGHGIWVPAGVAGQEGPCVLIVDDEADVRGLLCRMVKRMSPGARVYEAADGFEAGQRVMSLEPELIILDVHLPGMEGTGVCRNLRSRASYKKMRVLAISGDKDPAAREAILREGADAFLAKPFYPKELEAALRPLLE